MFALTACKGFNINSSSSSNESESSSSISDKDKITVTFYADFNQKVAKNIYKQYTLTWGDKVPKPENPQKLNDDFPNFIGWSIHEVIDDENQLFDFNTKLSDEIIDSYMTLDLFGIWDADEDPVGDITYTVDSMPDWITADDCVVFAWVWSESDPGSWKQTTFTNSTTLEFKVSEDLHGFLLVRCVAGTTEPDWGITSGNEPGRIFNKTADIPCSEGEYTYSCADWEEYGGGGGGDVTGDVIYTVNSMPDWITNDGCVVFAWVWSSTIPGAWVGTTYTNKTTLTFGVNSELNGFLLARCIAGTTTPNWDEKGDNSGRVYNKTSDITCSSGVFTYSCSSWQNN